MRPTFLRLGSAVNEKILRHSERSKCSEHRNFTGYHYQAWSSISTTPGWDGDSSKGALCLSSTVYASAFTLNSGHLLTSFANEGALLMHSVLWFSFTPWNSYLFADSAGCLLSHYPPLVLQLHESRNPVFLYLSIYSAPHGHRTQERVDEWLEFTIIF